MCRPKHVEQLRNIGIMNSTTRLHLVGSFYEKSVQFSLIIKAHEFVSINPLNPELNPICYLLALLGAPSCQDLHQIEENHKVPKEKTTMGFGENVYSKTNSAGYSRRETRCN